MAIREGSTEVYRYDIPRFLGYVCDFDGFLPVLLSDNLTFVTLANDLFDHTVHGGFVLFWSFPDVYGAVQP